MPKKSTNIWATFVIKFVAKKFQKSPILVTYDTRERERESKFAVFGMAVVS